MENEWSRRIEELTMTVRTEATLREQSRKSIQHRLIKYNAYDNIDEEERNYLEKTLLLSLRHLANTIYTNLHSTSPPKPLSINPGHNRNNIKYDAFGVINLKPPEEIKFVASKLDSQRLMLHVIMRVIELLNKDGYMTFRGLYYLSLDICRKNVNRLSRALDDISCVVGCSRVHLRILNQSKGLVYGDLRFKLKTGELYDCQSHIDGIRLPTPCAPIVELTSNAKFIIVIEKDSVFQKILTQEKKSNFVKNYKCILFTARGYPDINSRAFLNHLWTRLKIPILALTDADPHGLEIVCCYKFGCYATASEAQYLAVPQIRWLGLLPSDVQKRSPSQSSTLELNEYDRAKIRSLLERPYLKDRPEWREQLLIMRDEKKAELEAIDNEGHDYLVKTYLPNKLKHGAWL